MFLSISQKTALGSRIEGAFAPQKPSPWGKGAPKGADEGASFGLRLLCAGGFRRLRAASDFARGGKVTKTPPGTAPMSTSCS